MQSTRNHYPHDPSTLESFALEAADLVARHPPAFRHPHKQAVLARACPPGSEHRGTLLYARWAATSLPPEPPESMPVVHEEVGVFTYPPPPAGCFDWHVNFADPQLFVAYASSLLAQDELQALEHPALGSLREALLARSAPAVTEQDDQPTPVTIAGVERQCALDTTPDIERPRGLYGQGFAQAKVADVLAATTRLEPAPRSNVVAIAAPSGGQGRYRLAELRRILLTATTGFAAARLVGQQLAPGARSRLHTGFWGCGAFGGDRVLMALLQLVAARLASLDEVWFYSFDDEGSRAFAEAQKLLAGPLAPGRSTAAWLERVEARGFVWGQGDGN